MIERRIRLTDLKWSQEGDYEVENGDVADTRYIPARAFLQEVTDRVKSSANDWKLLKNKGANVDDFKGEINNSDTHAQLENAISFSLTRDRFLDQQDFQVLAAPVSTTEVAVRIDFDTSLTDVVPDSTIQLKLIYDTDGKGPFIIR